MDRREGDGRDDAHGPWRRGQLVGRVLDLVLLVLFLLLVLLLLVVLLLLLLVLQLLVFEFLLLVVLLLQFLVQLKLWTRSSRL
ncbi:hypothetical protein ABZ318_02735 [Streptomyces sp. NPDC006197]|uniref:hypothetical protein n=1 Tax=Streptomyces sp. NPDC006197 TaxID=3156685 RepID=UPI0033B2070A